MKRPHYGFTLVELLVVITIIGMLVGLLLPAVNMAREAGRRTQCENNLHQLSAALKAHSAQLGFYPSGGWGTPWVGSPDYGTGPNQPGGWIYQVLPYMDQIDLHDLGKGSPSISSSASATRVSRAIPALYCPTRRGAQAYPYSQTTNNTSSVTVAGRTDYAINGGSVYIPNGTGPAASTTLSTVATYTAWPNLVALNFNGIATVHSQVTESMIPDNKETTYLVGEKYLSRDNYIMGVDMTVKKNDPGDLYSPMSGNDVASIRWANTGLLPSQDRLSTNNPPPTPSQIFGSAHSAGWHAAFCDGHVQLIGWGINGTLHQAMGTRNGHEVVDASQIPN
jgi:prepilin-type N-terminal cleavage/methylation domain-containing protein